MELEIKLKETYNTILNTLIEYLKEETATIHAKIDEDKEKFLESLETTRVPALKVQDALENEVGGQDQSEKLGGLQKLRRRWCGVR